MPIFRYVCATPNGETPWSGEAIQKEPEPAPVCPCCDLPCTAKLTTAAFALRGGGWGDEGYKSVPRDSIPAAEVHDEIMHHAKEGGPDAVQKYQKDLAEKHGKH